MFSVLQYLHSFQSYSSFVLCKLETDDVINGYSIERNHKMNKNGSQKLKLGTNIVP